MAVSVIVETGAGVPNANAYLNVSAWKAAAEVSGWDYSSSPSGVPYTDDQIGAAIIRGRRAIDMLYRSRWPGEQSYDDQTTAWPRFNVVTDVGLDYPDDKVPQDIVDANAEAAWRELVEPGSMMPDLERGGAISSIKAGSVQITYDQYASATTTRSAIDGLVEPWLLPSDVASSVTWPLRA